MSLYLLVYRNQYTAIVSTVKFNCFFEVYYLCFGCIFTLLRHMTRGSKGASIPLENRTYLSLSGHIKFSFAQNQLSVLSRLSKYVVSLQMSQILYCFGR